jgi:hypothetical protein
MRRLLPAIVLATVAAAPAPARAWGFDVHRLIAERAIAQLPAPLRPFYDRHRATFVEHSIDPDLWRSAGFEEEPPRHFVDLDAYGRHPFTALPRDYELAVQKYGRDFVIRNGTLPWRVQEIFDRLVKAFSETGRPEGWAINDVKFFSSVLAHYVADAHVPFHSALNYDGQLTQQWGIHSRFESQVVMMNLSRIAIEPRPMAPVRRPRDFVFDTLIDGFPLVERILAVDRRAVRGRNEYDDEYFEEFFGGIEPIVEGQLSKAVSGVAAVIAGAWEAAGRPSVPFEPPPVTRKVRRAPAAPPGAR